MDKVILIRIGELYLKGKNRSFFENRLISNIKDKLSGFDCKLYFGRNRYVVSDFSNSDEREIIDALKTVFGLNSMSIGIKTISNYQKIKEKAFEIVKGQSGSFRIKANRADKGFPIRSVELAATLGGDILEFNSNMSVDLHNPNFILNVDIREDGNTYIFSDKIMGAGGMPVGTAGKGLLLLSGGIDSPVAGYMMAKRGLKLDAINFHSYPYTSEQAKDKVIELAKMLKKYCGTIHLNFLSFTKIQEAINRYCDDSYQITILRMNMMRTAERIALMRGQDCLINGESLGQVASQTMQSMAITNSVIEKLPVFRPLIGMDKHEIISISEKIGTYELSILPYEDCCTVFMPKNPVTKPQLARAINEEKKIPNLDILINEAIEAIEVIKI